MVRYVGRVRYLSEYAPFGPPPPPPMSFSGAGRTKVQDVMVRLGPSADRRQFWRKGRQFPRRAEGLTRPPSWDLRPLCFSANLTNRLISFFGRSVFSDHRCGRHFPASWGCANVKITRFVLFCISVFTGIVAPWVSTSGQLSLSRE